MKDEIMEKSVWLCELEKGRPLPRTADALYPGAPCAFRAVTGVLPLIRKSACLLIGPEICLYNARIAMSRQGPGHKRGTEPYLLLISDRDLIFGFSNPLKAAVREIREETQGAVFVVTTCLQEIIGEDFDVVIDELSAESEVPVIGIHTDNFKCDTADPGLENTMLALTKLMKPQLVREKSVNLWGVGDRRSRDSEVPRLLRETGVEIVTSFPAPCSLTELENAPATSLNLVMASRYLPMAEEMKSRFGTPYVYGEKPYTPQAITEMYGRIYRALGMDLPTQIMILKERAESRLLSLSKKLRGQTCVVGMLQGTQTGRYFNLAELLIKMGLDIRGLLIRDVLPSDWEDIDRLKKLGTDFPVLYAGNSMQSSAFLSAVGPDCYIGGGNAELLAGTGIRPINIRAARAESGFGALDSVLRPFEAAGITEDILSFKNEYIRKWERRI